MIDNLSEFVSNHMNVEQIKTMVSMIRLGAQVILITHICACLWILTGEYGLHNLDADG